MYFKLSRTFFCELLMVVMLLLCVVGEGYGQRVYATNYGYDESGPGLLGLISEGRVKAPENAVGSNSLVNSYSELVIGGLLGVARATYQIKFVNNSENLPPGTSIFIRVDGNTNSGLLGLLLASNGFLSAQRDSKEGDIKNISGTNVDLANNDIETVTVNGSSYLKISPTECFNSITFKITSAGLLGILSSANLKIYHAYYELPEIRTKTISPVCHGQSSTLEILNPLSTSCGQKYLWYEQATGGTPLVNAANGISYKTPSLFTGNSTTQKSYWVEYTGVDNSVGSRAKIDVTVLPKPPAPSLNINPNSQY